MSEEINRDKERVAVANNLNEVVEPVEIDSQDVITQPINEKSYFTR